MGSNSDLEKLIERYEPSRRDALRKILFGTAIYTAPVVASFSMKSLGGEAQAQLICFNQTNGPGCVPTSVPVDSGVALVAAAGAVGAAGAFMLRRRRRKDGDTER